MCLAIPGKIVEVSVENPLLRMGKVSFEGVIKEVSLVYVPEAREGEYVLVHAGFAISKVEESQAQEVFEYLRQIIEIQDADFGTGAGAGL